VPASLNDLRLVIPIPAELQAKDRQRLEKEKAKLTVDIEVVQKQLGNAHQGPQVLEHRWKHYVYFIVHCIPQKISTGQYHPLHLISGSTYAHFKSLYFS
jgi:hypothetical protein